VKGKFAYMAREQLQGGAIDRRADVYSAAIVLWETLVGERLFSDTAPESGPRSFRPPSALVPSVPEDLDGIVACALAEDREGRFTTAEAMAVALENAVKPASPERVAAWVARVAGARLRERAALVAEVEGAESRTTMPISPAPNAMAAPQSPPTAELHHPGPPSGPVEAPRTAPMTPRPLPEPSERTLLSATVDAEAFVPRSGSGESGRRPPPVTVEDPPEEPAPDKPSGMRLAVVAIIAAVAGAAIVTILFATRSAPEPSAPIASSQPNAAATVEGAVHPPPAASISSDEPAPPAPRSAEPSPRAAPKTRPPPRPRPPQAQLPPLPKSTCDPPYRVDADGTQHPKPECF
jgi:serine/threonine-protein kinase